MLKNGIRTCARGLHTTRPLGAFSLKSTKLRDSSSAARPQKKGSDAGGGGCAGGEKSLKKDDGPARTRFAPSPTGFVHLGSLRTALYNYLLARHTGGQFLLRLEDTDRNRVVEGAEENIRETLRWAGLLWDEEYTQSRRSEVYRQYADVLLDQGHAYRCFCPKERLDALRASARRLQPPSMASYDRKCAHTVSRAESDRRAATGEPHTLRFYAPREYAPFTDVLHGTLSLQTQVNPQDVRYEDPVLLKSDGLPTYHLANVVDDHLMGITHVVRGEEWLLSAPKHAAIYAALGWSPPQYAHIPLLTSANDRKLSKREGDASVLALARTRGILPEALVNFVALFGWSPNATATPNLDTATPYSGTATTAGVGGSDAEVFTMDELVARFSLDGLTRGNAKVDERKLLHFNQHFFRRRLADADARMQLIQECHARMQTAVSSDEADLPEYKRTDISYTTEVFNALQNNINSVMEFVDRAQYFYRLPTLASTTADTVEVLTRAATLLDDKFDPRDLCNTLLQQGYTKRQVFSSLRHALAGGVPGAKIPDILAILGPQRSKSRIDRAISLCK